MQPVISSPQELLARILSDRNVASVAGEHFLRPRYTLADPFLFAQMEEAVVRIFSAIEAKEAIGIYADYDCDGIPGAIILSDLFKKIGYTNFYLYIPDRHDEGYGLKNYGIDELATQGVKLLLTVDLGITAQAEVLYANSRGMEVIVTDHHIPLDEESGGFPAAFAVIHPLHGAYPNKHACGAAVAFHLVRAFLSKYQTYFSVPADWEKWLLDMVGFATLSDMVPLIEENRTLAKYGLLVMKKSKRIGLRALLRHLKIEQPSVTEDDLTFMVAPRLNAASRMDSPLRAFELLATDAPDRAQELVQHLSKINDERKTLVAQTMREAEKKLKNRELGKVIVVGDPTWRPAILGLVASKLQETHNRTVFVWGEGGDELLKGSTRADPKTNVALLMKSAPPGTFLHFGGHRAAGGFAISKEQVHFLENILSELHQNLPCEELGGGCDPYVATLAVVHKKYWDIVEQCSPFGIGNAKPLFSFSNITITAIKQFGKGKEHIELKLVDRDNNTATAISFFTSVDDFGETLKEGRVITLTANLDHVQGYFGNGVRLRIEDIVVLL